MKKFWLDSSTMRANLLNVLPAIYLIAKLFGIEFPDGLLEHLVEGVIALFSVVSIVGVFIGRVNATHTIVFDKSEATDAAS